MRPALLLLAAGFLLAGASAFSIHSSSDVLGVSSCTTGFATVYVDGAQEGAQAFFGVEGGQLSARVEPSVVFVSSSRSASARVAVNAPACLRGRFQINANARVCSQGFCESRHLPVLIDVVPCAAESCSFEARGGYAGSGQGTYYSSCVNGDCAYSSKFERTDYFKPQYYATELERANNMVCKQKFCDIDQAQPGQSIAFEYRVRNLGAPGSFQVSAAASGGAPVSVTPSSAVMELAASEVARASVRVTTAKNAAAGLYKFTVSVMHGNVVLDSRKEWIEVIPALQPAVFALDVPSTGLVFDGCSIPANLSVKARLQHGERDFTEFKVNSSVNGMPAYSEFVSIAPGVIGEFYMSFPGARKLFNQARNIVAVSVSSDGFGGEGAFQVIVQPCSTAVKVEGRMNAADSEMVVLAVVENDGNSALYNVTGELAGLPAGWNYSPSIIALIEAGENATLRLAVQPADGEAEPTLLVKSNGRLVASLKLEKISRQAGVLTGLFTAVIGSGWALLLLVLVALAAAPWILVNRSEKKEGGKEVGTRNYVERMRELRRRIEEPAPSSTG